MIDFNAVSDEDLYAMCRAGDEDAWQYVYNCILIICKWNKWNLEDEPGELAQDITMHLIEKAINKVRERNKFRSFIKTVSINKIKDSFKTYKATVSIDQPQRSRKGDEYIPEYRDTAPLHDSAMINMEIASIIDAALKKLSDACQKIVGEYFNFKLGIYKDYKELSRVLKMPVPTISAGVRRCLNKLVELKDIKALKA